MRGPSVRSSARAITTLILAAGSVAAQTSGDWSVDGDIKSQQIVFTGSSVTVTNGGPNAVTLKVLDSAGNPIPGKVWVVGVGGSKTVAIDPGSGQTVWAVNSAGAAKGSWTV